MRHLSIILSAITVVFSFDQAQAKIIHVPADSSTIERGIDGAVNRSPYVVCDNSVADSDGYNHEWHDSCSSRYPDSPLPGNPIFRAIGKAGSGVVLIHGYIGSNENWGNLGEILEDKGKRVKFFSHLGTDIPIETLAVWLQDSLDEWNEELEIEERGVDIVAHSMGGLIARYYVSHHVNHVNKLVTLGTPQYGTYAANQAGQFPFSFFPTNSVQAREMALGSSFLWSLHHDWAAYIDTASQKPDVLTIVGSRDDGPHSWCLLYPSLYICPYGDDIDYYDDTDGLISVNSASLENFGTPVYYVPRNHVGPGDLVYILDDTHPSYAPIDSFLAGVTPVTPPQDDIGDTDHDQYSEIGNFLLGLHDPSGNPIGVEYVNWPPGVEGENSGRNDQMGVHLYFASMVQPGSHTIVVGPNAAYKPIEPVVNIAPHQTNVYEFAVDTADASATNIFGGGNTEPQVFGNTGVTMDFSYGPGGSVFVYRFDDQPPAVDSGTLPHYWNLDSDFLDIPFWVTITFDYDESEVSASGLTEAELKVAYYDTLWHPMNTDVDPDNNQVSVSTDHFSLFAIGSFTGTGIEEEAEISPLLPSFVLFQNYPNPFNQSTKIQFTLVKSGLVTLSIYDLLGRKVRTLVSEHLSSGYRSVLWDGKDNSDNEVASGVYFYRLSVEDFSETKKLLLLK